MTNGVVYIVGEDVPVPEVVKIGWSTQLASRVASLQTAAHKKLKIFRVIDGETSETEKWMHDRFADLRLSGEWFKFSDDMLTVVPPLVKVEAIKSPPRPKAILGKYNPDLILGRKDDHAAHFDYLLGKWVDDPPKPRIVPIPENVFSGPASVVVWPGEGLIINGATLTFSGRTNVMITGSVQITKATCPSCVESEAA